MYFVRTKEIQPAAEWSPLTAWGRKPLELWFTNGRDIAWDIIAETACLPASLQLVGWARTVVKFQAICLDMYISTSLQPLYSDLWNIETPIV